MKNENSPIDKRYKAARLIAGLLFVLWCSVCSAQTFVAPYVTLQGPLTNASGLPAQNATLTFNPSQVFFIGGTATIVSPSQCATDSNGNVVGLADPAIPQAFQSYGGGTLPAANYYIKIAWYDATGAHSGSSPEIIKQMVSVGSLTVQPPVSGVPSGATGFRVYISTTPGTETFQGQTSSGSFVQSTPLVTGISAPTTNTTQCRLIANDAGWPTGTGYSVSLIDASGNPLFVYPELWQFLGPGSTYNLANGIPYYHGQVSYPVPVLTVPYNHNMQSISGPLSMGQPGGVAYNIVNVNMLGVGTSLPAWGVDVEGAGVNGLINAKGGYLINGSGGTAGQCLGSDGTAYDVPIVCLTSFPTIFYQLVLNGTTAASQLTQRSYLAVDSSTGLIATDVAASGANVARTVLSVNTTGSLSADPKIVNAVTAGASGHCASWDANGGMGDAGSACSTVPAFTGLSGYQTLPSGLIFEWGHTGTFDTGPATIPFPLPFPHAVFSVVLTGDVTCNINSRIWSTDGLSTSSFIAKNDGTGCAYWLAAGY